MSIHLYKHNEDAYRAVETMLEEKQMAAVIHPTGTGKSMIAFKLVEQHPHKHFLWLSPSEYIYKTQLENIDTQFSMNRYIVHDVADGMAFGDVIKRITRGAQLNAKALDEITTTVPTDMQYLMLANIKNGLIDKELPYLKSIDKKNDKYCLSNHCLILSKNGYPYKIAVAEVKEGQRILGNGNLYIIELDEEKADPYYLAAFFGSEQGTAALRSITVGATIPNIGVEQLTKLVIPIPPLEKQKEIADKYKTVKEEITMLQLKLEKAKNRMAHIIEEGGTNNA